MSESDSSTTPAVKVALFGAAGRMGRVLLQQAAAAPDLVVVAALDRADHPAQGEVLVAGTPPLSASLASGTACDVLIDFSNAGAVAVAVQMAVEHRLALISGTTGTTAAQDAAFEAASRDIPVLTAPNMSLGVNLLLELTTAAAQALGADWDIEISETHHRHKRDAPSGTALALGRAAAAGRGLAPDEVLRTGRTGDAPRTGAEIGISAIRGGDVAGEHTVFFLGNNERIELTHRATDRVIFVAGALQAARWLASRQPGRYSMRDVLFGER